LNGSFLVVLKRDPVSGDFGMVIRGGRDFNMSLYVLRLVCESPAQQDGRLQAGDEILEINGQPTRNLRLLEAVNLIRSRNTVSLIVRRSGMPPPTVADVMKAASML
jgi:C-terminal processing protease CtpA/Prc